jgi:hypothetical protein
LQEELAQQKQKHILKLKTYEVPQLVTAAKPKAPPPEAMTKPAAATLVVKTEGGSGGSGMFDDVGDDYEVDVTSLKEKQKHNATAKVRRTSIRPGVRTCISCSLVLSSAFLRSVIIGKRACAVYTAQPDPTPKPSHTHRRTGARIVPGV